MFRIGTRGSKLALWQANHVQSLLLEHQIESEIIVIQTKGDRIQDLSFDKLEGKGFFTKEIEDALLENKIDVAVHSLKDLPTVSPDGLSIAGLSYREQANDCLIVNAKHHQKDRIMGLAENARIGTSSARRKAFIKALFPTISTVDIRGNVPTRIQKLVDEDMDAIILAKAGINRLKINLSDHFVYDLHHREFPSAPGQGVIAFQCREDDRSSIKIIRKIHHASVAKCTNVERKVLQAMDGGCQLPLGVYCHVDQSNYYHVSAAYLGSNDTVLKRVFASQNTTAGLAESILSQLGY